MIIQRRVHSRMYDYFSSLLCYHKFMKADLRIPVKNHYPMGEMHKLLAISSVSGIL